MVDGSGNVHEYKLADHTTGTELAASVAVVSKATVQGVTTITVTRPLAGATPDHYSFSTATEALHVLAASGTTAALSYVVVWL